MIILSMNAKKVLDLPKCDSPKDPSAATFATIRTSSYCYSIVIMSSVVSCVNVIRQTIKVTLWSTLAAVYKSSIDNGLETLLW